MFLRKFIKHGMRSPLCMMNVLALMRTRYISDISTTDLAEIVHQQNFPNEKISGSVIPITIDDSQYYLRLYGSARLDCAARHLWATRHAPYYDIPTPTIQQTCVTNIAGKSYFAILEQRLAGTELGEQPWPIDLAINFASGLARWHGITENNYRRYQCIMHNKQQHDYKLHFNHLMHLNNVHAQEYSDLLEHARNLLSDKSLFSDVRISHGDINPHNILVQKNLDMFWIDMDMLGVRPVWNDLVTIMCKFTHQISPDAMNSFEQHYFEKHPHLHDSWLRIRNRWLFLRNVLEGLKWHTVHLRPGVKVHNDNNSDIQEWARRYYKQARVILNHIDSKLDTGALVTIMFDMTRAAGTYYNHDQENTLPSQACALVK